MNRVLFASLLLAACHHDAAKPVAPAPVAATVPATPNPAATKQTDASPNLAVSDDLAAKCGLKFNSVSSAPKFGFDDIQLEQQDRDVLQSVATCLTSGPLKGRTVTLVGRADPRGTDEYNLALGHKRAQSVGTYLTHLGVQQGQLAMTTRGATEANGTDESGWKNDRRVDLTLQ